MPARPRRPETGIEPPVLPRAVVDDQPERQPRGRDGCSRHPGATQIGGKPVEKHPRLPDQRRLILAPHPGKARGIGKGGFRSAGIGRLSRGGHD